VAFAVRYDPQPCMSMPGRQLPVLMAGLIPSGWMTVGLMMRLLVLHYVSTCAALASPGFDAVRWFRPLRPGGSLWLRMTIETARVSQSRRDMGIVTILMEGIAQDGVTIAQARGTGIMLRRPQGRLR
jgi:acyl dehydratase